MSQDKRNSQEGGYAGPIIYFSRFQFYNISPDTVVYVNSNPSDISISASVSILFERNCAAMKNLARNTRISEEPARVWILQRKKYRPNITLASTEIDSATTVRKGKYGLSSVALGVTSAWACISSLIRNARTVTPHDVALLTFLKAYVCDEYSRRADRSIFTPTRGAKTGKSKLGQEPAGRTERSTERCKVIYC